MTIGGRPVYCFSKDQQPGDIMGQGVGNTWFAINPKDGKTTVQQSSNQSTSGSQSSNSGQSSGNDQPGNRQGWGGGAGYRPVLDGG